MRLGTTFDSVSRPSSLFSTSPLPSSASSKCFHAQTRPTPIRLGVTRSGRNLGSRYESDPQVMEPETISANIVKAPDFSDAGTRRPDGALAEVEVVEEKSGNMISEYWDALPGRYRIMVATCMAFMLCNMDKVNMSVAIIPMAQEFGWSSSVSGIVQSSFFYGYMLCQLPGGFLSSRFTGSRMLPIGVGLWSAATAAVPILGGSVGGLCVSRAAVGLGESLSPAAATDMVARSVPKEERSRAVSLVFGGFHVGTILGLLASPVLVENFGWQSVFYVFGVMGLVWVGFFENLVNDVRKTDPEFIGKMRGETCNAIGVQADEPLPWRAMLRNRPLQALMYTHFCNNWFHFTMLAWLPTYFVDTLHLDLTHASQIALLPPLAGIAVSSIAGPLADFLIGKGFAVSNVRKAAQCTAFLGPLLCLVGATISDNGVVDTVSITTALGLSSFSLAGLYCNHQDLSPKYASIMLGMTNTIGAFPGIAGVAISGYLLDQTGSWSMSLFVPSMFFFLTGSIVYSMYGSGELQDLSDNRPFEIESKLKSPQWDGVKTAFQDMLKKWDSKNQ
ncbi:hypothetical protein BSKO_04981 [Bryopsis sp. KO-2023]|nr:hypothetical protein BSKO_04981 [Bryopsis sp. KO-2023]